MPSVRPLVLLVVAAVLTAALTTGALLAAAGGRTLTVREMNGIQEVDPGDPDGSGDAVVTLHRETGRVCYSVRLRDVGFIRRLHIHEGRRNTNGLIMVNLPVPRNGRVSAGCVAASRATIDQIAADPLNHYVNVHTEEFDAGAIRGHFGD